MLFYIDPVETVTWKSGWESNYNWFVFQVSFVVYLWVLYHIGRQRPWVEKYVWNNSVRYVDVRLIGDNRKAVVYFHYLIGEGWTGSDAQIPN